MPFLTVDAVIGNQIFQNGLCVICFSLGRISYISVYMSLYITYTACKRRYTTGLWKASIRIFTFVAGFLLCQVTCQYTVCILEIRGRMNGSWKEKILISYISRIITSGFSLYATVKFVFGFFELGLGVY